MGEEPDRIRDEIARTREKLGGPPVAQRMREEYEEGRAEMQETIEALGHKADVKGRVKESIGSAKDSVVDSTRSAVSKVTGAAPDMDGVKRGARKIGISTQNPLGLAIGGAAVGFLAGLLAPRTSIEDEKLGPVAEELKARAAETGSEVAERGRQIAEETLESAKQAASEATQREGAELAASVAESAREATSGGGGSASSGS